jgi:O-antigen/teichoic acid export membrane protein
MTMVQPAQSFGRRVAGLRPLLPGAVAYAGSSATLILGSIAQLLAFAILARSLGPEQFGGLLTITAITNVALNLVGFGANEPMVRRIAVDPQLYPKMLGHNLVLSAGSAIFVLPATTVAIAAYTHISQHQALPVATALAFALANAVFLRFVLVAEQAFIARRQFGAANLVNLGLGLSRISTAALACLVFGVDNLSAWALWHLSGLALLSAGCALGIAPLGRPLWTIRIEDLRQGFYFQIAQLGLALRQTIDILVLGLVAPAPVVGNFGIARRIVEASYLTVNALYRITYPRLSAAMAAGNEAGREMALKVAAAALVIAMATAVSIYLCAPALPAVFGANYEASVGFVRALCFVLIPYALWTVGAESLGASASQGKRAMLINSSILGVAAVALLTYLFGTDGTIVAIYSVDIALAGAFWWVVLLTTAERDRL